MEKPRITSGGKERVQDATNLLHKVFYTDPVITYMLASLSKEESIAYMPNYFDCLLTAAALNGGTFGEIDDWSSCAVLIPPGRRVDNPMTWLPSGLIPLLWKLGYSGFSRMVFEYQGKGDAAKAEALKKGDRYYYIFFIGTREDRRGRGLSSDLIRYYQSIAQDEGLPIWLEATTPYSAKLYAKLGFETVDGIVLGKGIAAPDGTTLKGGEGVKVQAMIWRPKSDDLAGDVS